MIVVRKNIASFRNVTDTKLIQTGLLLLQERKTSPKENSRTLDTG